MISRRGFVVGVGAAYLAKWKRMYADRQKSSTRIGNLHYLAPNGIAFVKDDAAGFVINPGGSHRAGTGAPDDSYHKVVLVRQASIPGERLVEFEWSRMGEVVVGRLISERAGEMTFKLGENWPGFETAYSVGRDGVTGVGALGSGETVNWRLRTEPQVKSGDGAGFTVTLGGPGKPTYLVAGFGELPAFTGIDKHLAQAAKAYEDRRPRIRGASGDVLAAISDNMNNSRIYSSDNKMVAISVSRTFGSQSANACPYFCWDSFFSGLLASLDDPAMGRDTVRAILTGQTAEGLVPNFMHWNDGDVSLDRSQPPVGSMCIWKMHLRWPDKMFLREVYPKLATWHAWWMKERNSRNDGLLQWGTTTGHLPYAMDETGWDDTPHFEGVDGVKMVGHTMNCYAVDLCSLWAMDAIYLALIADAIGKPEEAKIYRKQAEEMNERINAKLWNEKLGLYCSRFWDNLDGTPGDFLTRLTPANFYPLICGAPDAIRAQKVIDVMKDPEQFWGEWILPTVSRKDPAYRGQTYWHGTIWGPVNYLVFQGVKRYASPEVQAEFAQKCVHLFMNNWLANGYCGENFLSIDGSVPGNRYYTWGALMCLIGVESIVDLADDGTVRLGSGYNEAVELRNLPIAGKLLNASLSMGKAEVSIVSLAVPPVIKPTKSTEGERLP